MCEPEPAAELVGRSLEHGVQRGVKTVDTEVKGRSTIRITAVLFILSAMLGLLSVTDETPLFGGIRGGWMAVIYHLTYVVAFLAVGVGLWRARPWGYWAVMATTAFYTLDTAQFLLARQTLRGYVMEDLSVLPELPGGVPTKEVLTATTLLYVTLLVCWWGFAVYIHLRRAYFASAASEPR
jgi:hypothetical protein